MLKHIWFGFFALLLSVVSPMSSDAAVVHLGAGPGGNAGSLTKTGSGQVALSSGAPIVYLQLGSGSYDVRALGGGFLAWSAWRHLKDCDANGAGCTKGYTWAFSWFEQGEFDSAPVGNLSSTLVAPLGSTAGSFYSTPGAAFSAVGGAVVKTFHLTAPTVLGFYIQDYLESDNTGGVSFSVTKSVGPAPVPLPSGGLLFGSVIAGLGLVVRRRGAGSAPAV